MSALPTEEEIFTNSTSKPTERVEVPVSACELLVIELYAETLLSRAHFLFFLTALADTPPQKRDILYQDGIAALEEAEALCMSGRYSVSSDLEAKYWFVKGFLAQSGGDDRNATEYYVNATEINGSYEAFEGARKLLHRRGDDLEMDDMWDQADSDSGSLDGLGAVPRDLASKPPHSPPSPLVDAEQARPDSVLFTYLYGRVKEPAEAKGSTTGNVSSPSSPLNAIQSRSSSTDDVSNFVKELISAPPRKRPSADRHQTPTPVHHSSESKGPRLEKEKEQAAKESKERNEILRARLETKPTPTDPSSHEEALLSDTPSMTNLVASVREPVPQVIPSPSKPKLNIQATRRLSASNKSAQASPTTPSPLRNASFPGESAEGAD
ncbi:hypothetical protein LTR99_004639 [Exophiala xenobiotica]|uniref:Uncharacterized protein n=1 Tax=Vermiconidia calcicola TaxID=1690605 RepID=A0AAV9QET6_9PEZI|nr:hypothetical protein H2202_003105 [Exophiala xenobiotica]KAK5539920.1 hypothetical protein LTR25_003625 [Vermiconidia calcicola]KAK5546961.1 hypothetical protein LTR23_002964 [Chaetothyriales sp. CCFEE 6169]KAK5199843.1 hypothetical protein LTR92_000384 [Exophiala xenobiotica]KAK5211012.1 hypothetical protein LTR41_003624 [Exophiala xenobiotica]